MKNPIELIEQQIETIMSEVIKNRDLTSSQYLIGLIELRNKMVESNERQTDRAIHTELEPETNTIDPQQPKPEEKAVKPAKTKKQKRKPRVCLRSAQEALDEEPNKFFVGSPCSKCGNMIRYRSNRVCFDCTRDYTKRYNLNESIREAQREAQKRNNQTDHRKEYMKEYKRRS